jgi:hypothetical protein
MVSPERLPVPDAELSRPALVLAQRFVQRWDPHARQLDDGSYVCVHEPLNVGHLLDHLRGEITFPHRHWQTAPHTTRSLLGLEVGQQQLS